MWQRAQDCGFLEYKSIGRIPGVCAGIRMRWLPHLQCVLVERDPMVVVGLRRGQNTAWFGETSPRSQMNSLWICCGSPASGTLLQAHPREQFIMNKPQGDAREVLDISASLFSFIDWWEFVQQALWLCQKGLRGFFVNIDHTKMWVRKGGTCSKALPVFCPGPLCQHLPPCRLLPGGCQTLLGSCLALKLA